MKLIPPFPLSTKTQNFGDNANGLYASQGLKGHTADDFAPADCWDTPVKACVSGLVYSIINKDNPDLSKYRAVYQLVEDESGNWFEVSYGHLNQVLVTPGQTVVAGDILGTVGNTGPVYHNGVEVPSSQKTLPNRPGAHLHGPQVRPVLRVAKLNGTSLYDGYGVYRDSEGYYFQVKDPNNGYAGCISPDQFFISDPIAQADQIVDSIDKLKQVETPQNSVVVEGVIHSLWDSFLALFK